MNLLDLIEPPKPKVPWSPPELPDLSAFSEVYYDAETNGLRWWKGELPIGVAVGVETAPGTFKSWYLPWAHRGGGNLDESAVYRWAQRNLRGKKIYNLNVRFDAHMARAWGEKNGGGGLDFEAMGCSLSDVGHTAALLDDFRFKFSLESLITDFLPDEAKVTTVEGWKMDTRRMADYHAGQVAARAEGDVRAVWKLKNVFAPMVKAEQLEKVHALEDQVIFPVIEMEKNGALIDVDLLDRWVKESETALNRLYHDIYKATGMQVNPKANDSMERLFTRLGLPIAKTENGNASFTAEILKAVDHPVIHLVVRAKKLSDLRSKYLLPYAKCVDRRTGIIRYALNQLKSQKDPWSDDSKGTISGRFSSSAPVEDEGMNIQQILKAMKQRVSFGFEEDDDSHDDEIFLIRRLHVPSPGAKFLSADAMQIEYRLFASETKSPRLIDIYDKEPLASFHRKTHAMLRVYKPDLTYRRQKDVNFANVYGAGLLKQALMLEFITKEKYQELRRKQFARDRSWHDDPGLKEMKEIAAIYNREIPEVKPLLEYAKKLAETRGYIRTIEGRRSRFKKRRWNAEKGETEYYGDAHRSHKALNTRIQGSAADIMKRKLVELHEQRKATGFLLRYTVHDEVDGDAFDGEETARKVSTVLNRQSFPSLRVPILWEIGMGENWMDAGRETNEFDQKEIISAALGYKDTGDRHKRMIEGR